MLRSMLPKVSQVSAIRSRRAADRGRSREIMPFGLRGPVSDVAVEVVAAMVRWLNGEA